MNRNQNPQWGKRDFFKALKKSLKRYQSMPRLYGVIKYGVLFMVCSPGLIILAGFLKTLGVPLPDIATIRVLMECALMLDGMLVMVCGLISLVMLSLSRTEEHDERYFAQPGERREEESDSVAFPDYWRLYLPKDFGERELVFFIVLAVLPAFVFIPLTERSFFRVALIAALALLVSVNLSRGLFWLVCRLRCYRTKIYEKKKEGKVLWKT